MCRGAGDGEVDPELLSGRVGEDFLDELLVIVLEPDFAEIIRDFEGNAVAFECLGADGGEPQMVDVRIEHLPEQILGGFPDLGRSGGVFGFAGCHDELGDLIHLLRTRSRNIPFHRILAFPAAARSRAQCEPK